MGPCTWEKKCLWCVCVCENKRRVVRVTEIRVKVCMTFFTVSVIEITEECVSRAY